VAFVAPAPWIPLPVKASYAREGHAAWVRSAGGRGNVEVAVDLTGEIAATRKARATTVGLAPELVEAERAAGRSVPYLGASPTGRPTPPGVSEEPTVEVETLSVARRQFQARQPLAPAVPLPTLPAIPLSARPQEPARAENRRGNIVRRDIRTFLIPAEAVQRFRDYRVRLQATPSLNSQERIVVGAAYALYTSKLGALAQGVRATPLPRGGFTFTPASEVPGRGVQGLAATPGFGLPKEIPATGVKVIEKGEGLPPEFGVTLPIGAQTPVFYETGLGLLFYTLGPLNLYKNHFNNILERAGWYAEGRVLGSNIFTYRPPPVSPTLPPPPAFYNAEAPAARFPQQPRGKGTLPEGPAPKYRKFE